MKSFKEFAKKFKKKLTPLHKQILDTQEKQQKEKEAAKPLFYPIATKFGKGAKKTVSESFITVENPSKTNKALSEKIHNNEEKNASFSKPDKEILQNYSKGSNDINSYLHKNHRGEKKHEGTVYPTIIKNLDQAFANKGYHVGMNHTVYTGLPESPQRIVDKERKRIGKEPEHVHAHLPAFTSTSTDMKVAKAFTEPDTMDDKKIKGHVLKINVPKDHPAISMKHLSKYKHENEVLLHRGTRLKINAKPITVGHHAVWEADVVGHEPDTIK